MAFDIPSNPQTGDTLVIEDKEYEYDGEKFNLKPVTITKADVGLDQVDNTSDIDKPVSTLQQEEIDTKQDVDNLVVEFQVVPDDIKYPSEKLVKDSIDSLESRVGNNDSDIEVLSETISNLASSSGQITSSTSQAITTSEQVLTFEVDTQSTDTSIFEFDETNNSITYKKAGSYNFISTLNISSSNSSTIDIEFNIRDTSDDSLIKQQLNSVTIPENSSETMTVNTLVLLEDTQVPLTVDINYVGSDTGLTIEGFDSILNSSNTAQGVKVHNDTTGRDEVDSHPIGAITGLQDELDNKLEVNWIDGGVADSTYATPQNIDGGGA